MYRIDIVVFPNGNREIFGQIPGANMSALLPKVNSFVAKLETSDKPRKFTGYYDTDDASDLDWSDYDESNPIVMVPTEPAMLISEDDDMHIDTGPVYMPVELSDVPEELRENYLPKF